MSEQMTEAEAHEAMDEQYAEQQREARLEALAAQSGPELLGMPHFEDGEQLGCDECGETTPAEDWKPHGPTYRENGRSVKEVVSLDCPACGASS